MTLSPISEKVKDIEKYNLELHIHAKDNGKYIKKTTSKPPETSHKRYSTYPQGWHGQITKDQLLLHFYTFFEKDMV